MKKPRKRELARNAKNKLRNLLKEHNCSVGVQKKEDGEYYLVVRVTGKMTEELKGFIPLDVDGFKVEVVVMGKVYGPRPLPDKPNYKKLTKEEVKELKEKLLKKK